MKKLQPSLEIRKNLSENIEKEPQRPKKSSRRHPKVPPEGLRRPNFPRPGPLRNPSRSRKSPIFEKVDYSREGVRKSPKGYPHWVVWPQLPVRPSRALLLRDSLLFETARTPNTLWGRRIRLACGHCRRPLKSNREPCVGPAWEAST